ncbi:MAG: hypothetical protein LBS68_01125 [Puniceicoccales bacterium]|jgi:hypothetical protein|nr:hypothetical protein [Puniceicoccales bacterium]
MLLHSIMDIYSLVNRPWKMHFPTAPSEEMATAPEIKKGTETVTRRSGHYDPVIEAQRRNMESCLMFLGRRVGTWRPDGGIDREGHANAAALPQSPETAEVPTHGPMRSPRGVPPPSGRRYGAGKQVPCRIAFDPKINEYGQRLEEYEAEINHDIHTLKATAAAEGMAEQIAGGADIPISRELQRMRSMASLARESLNPLDNARQQIQRRAHRIQRDSGVRARSVHIRVEEGNLVIVTPMEKVLFSRLQRDLSVSKYLWKYN